MEVYSSGSWGTICDDSWDLNDASVICRELGYGQAAHALREASFGHGNGPITMDDVRCTGNEKTVFECQHNGLGIHNCYDFEDAGVRCGEY